MKRTWIIGMLLVMAVSLIAPSVTVSAASKKKPALTVTANVKKSAYKKLKKGDTVQLKVKYGKKNVTKKAKYKTSKKKVISVSKRGKLTAKASGTAAITVKYKGKIKKVKFTVMKTSEKKKTSDKNKDKTDNEIMNPGCFFIMGPKMDKIGGNPGWFSWVEPKYNNPVYLSNDPETTWRITLQDTISLLVIYDGLFNPKSIVTSKSTYKSSNPNVIEVTKEGKLIPKGYGTCEISVTYNKMTKTLKFMCAKPELRVSSPYELSINTCKPEEMEAWKKERETSGWMRAESVTNEMIPPYIYQIGIDADDTVQLKTLYGKEDMTAKAVYTSTDENVISVTDTGMLVPKSVGKCDIQVSYDGQVLTFHFETHEHGYMDDVYCWKCNGCGRYHAPEKTYEDALKNATVQHPGPLDGTVEHCDHYCTICHKVVNDN